MSSLISETIKIFWKNTKNQHYFKSLNKVLTKKFIGLQFAGKLSKERNPTAYDWTGYANNSSTSETVRQATLCGELSAVKVTAPHVWSLATNAAAICKFAFVCLQQVGQELIFTPDFGSARFSERKYLFL